jgi:hypothetical protein
LASTKAVSGNYYVTLSSVFIHRVPVQTLVQAHDDSSTILEDILVCNDFIAPEEIPTDKWSKLSHSFEDFSTSAARWVDNIDRIVDFIAVFRAEHPHDRVSFVAWDERTALYNRYRCALRIAYNKAPSEYYAATLALNKLFTSIGTLDRYVALSNYAGYALEVPYQKRANFSVDAAISGLRIPTAGESSPLSTVLTHFVGELNRSDRRCAPVNRQGKFKLEVYGTKPVADFSVKEDAALGELFLNAVAELSRFSDVPFITDHLRQKMENNRITFEDLLLMLNPATVQLREATVMDYYRNASGVPKPVSKSQLKNLRAIRLGVFNPNSGFEIIIEVPNPNIVTFNRRSRNYHGPEQSEYDDGSLPGRKIEFDHLIKDHPKLKRMSER